MLLNFLPGLEDEGAHAVLLALGLVLAHPGLLQPHLVLLRLGELGGWRSIDLKKSPQKSPKDKNAPTGIY